MIRAAIILLFLYFTLITSTKSEENSTPKTHWSFVKPTEPAIPTVNNHNWPKTDIDRFLLAKMEAAGFSPNEMANKRTLIRRATYDLTGLPPTPTEIISFINDPSPNAFTKVIERLLASPRYGERWGRHWLDVVRYADTAGENSDMPVDDAWRYRNYVIKAFNNDTPFNQFIREQLAGDIIAKKDSDCSPDRYADLIVATGYLAISRRHGHDAKKDHYLTIEDTIDTLGKSFLGLTIACARCHDHKYDPISARDYYGLYGIFASSLYSFPGSEGNRPITDLVPLNNSKEIKERKKAWEEHKLKLEQELKSAKHLLSTASDEFAKMASQPATLIKDGEINVGAQEAYLIENLNVHKGDMIQLIVDAKDGDYGADTTIIEMEMTELRSKGLSWNITDEVVDDFLSGNPHPDKMGNPYTWLFLDARQPGKLLEIPVKDNEGHIGNNVWRTNPLPSAFVNANNTPIKAWTTLPPKTFFVHPAADGPVGVGWTSPINGSINIQGLVKDGHKYGNGVSWKLIHLKGNFLPLLAKPKKALAAVQVAEKRIIEWTKKEIKIAHAYGVTEGKLINEKMHLRGNPKDLGEPIPRKNLDLLGGQSVTDGSGRLQLAEWISSAKNPLTARVIVNRVWLNHFGRGLVTTPNDFGTQGQKPTHTALLDWLSLQFIKNNWSIKELHRMIMNSKAYQIACKEGPEQKLYGAFKSRRLSAEELRDTLLSLGQKIDYSTPSGHPFPAAKNYTQHTPFRANYNHYYRSVFLMAQRIQRRPLMALFDGADTNASTGQRRLSNVPTQALYFLNNEFLHAQAAAFAKRLTQHSIDINNRIHLAHELALGRAASEKEIEQAGKFIQTYTLAADEPQAWNAWCRVLLSSNEFLFLN